jgi:hypothetical protein
MKQHKWHKEIKAWADGAEIEFYFEDDDEWLDAGDPEWNEDSEYRIKQQPKKLISAKELIKQVVDEYNASCDKEPQYAYLYGLGYDCQIHLVSPIGMPKNYVYLGKIKLEDEDD